jgi:hypothetical protein
MSDTAFEKHYTISELAKLWGLSISAVHRIVVQEEGVVRLTGISGKTSHRVPESVARRIHTVLITPKRKPQSVAAR